MTHTPSRRSRRTQVWKLARSAADKARTRGRMQAFIGRALTESIASSVGAQTFPVRLVKPHPGIEEMVIQADGTASVKLVQPLERVTLTGTLFEETTQC